MEQGIRFWHESIFWHEIILKVKDSSALFTNSQRPLSEFTLFASSLSTIVLNSRDWSEIVWLPKISRFKINLAIGFIRKKPTGMHWLGYNDAISWLNEGKTQIFQPTANF